jgi:hypothetical protein
MFSACLRESDFDKETPMAQILKDATITRRETHRLTAETTGGAGKRGPIINLDGKYADSLQEWLGVWYYNVGLTGPLAKQEIIGSTPEEALEWWVRSRGFVFT